jgi:hypothetical protein
MHPAGCPSGNVVRRHKSRLVKFAMLPSGLEREAPKTLRPQN